MILNLTKGLTDNDEYKAFTFLGGELHIIIKKDYNPNDKIRINTRVNCSDDLMLLILTVDTLRKDNPSVEIEVMMPYMPYQQADRDFGEKECFSLQTVTRLLNSLNVTFLIFDPHSDVTPALLRNIKRIDNSGFIMMVTDEMPEGQTVWLSPDAGAYKKIGKLATKLDWRGDIAAANKYRNTSSGNIESTELSIHDFKGKDVLIIDDICMGGNTFIGLANKLREYNVGKLFLAVSHMISNEPNPKLLNTFDRVFTTNSRHAVYHTTTGNLTVLNIF